MYISKIDKSYQNIDKFGVQKGFLYDTTQCIKQTKPMYIITRSFLRNLYEQDKNSVIMSKIVRRYTLIIDIIPF